MKDKFDLFVEQLFAKYGETGGIARFTRFLLKYHGEAMAQDFIDTVMGEDEKESEASEN